MANINNILPRDVLLEIIKFAVCDYKTPLTPGMIVKCVKIFNTTPEFLITLYVNTKNKNNINTPGCYSLWYWDVIYYVLKQKYVCKIDIPGCAYSVIIEYSRESGGKKIKSYWSIHWNQMYNKYLNASITIQRATIVNESSYPRVMLIDPDNAIHKNMKWYELYEFVADYISKHNKNTKASRGYI